MHIASTIASNSSGISTIYGHATEQANKSNLVIRPAASYREERACSMLVHRMYSWRGYLVDPPASNVSYDQLTLAAWQDGELAATLTLSRDNGKNLLAEALYPEEIAKLRATARRICEYSRLAIDPIFSSPQLLEGFFRTAYDLAHAHYKASDAIVEVNPRHRRFYEREVGFSLLGPLRVCPRVDAPALLLHRDMEQSFKSRQRTSRVHLQLPDLPVARHPITP